MGQQIFAAMLDENVNQNEIANAKRNRKQTSSRPPPGSTGPRRVTKHFSTLHFQKPTASQELLRFLVVHFSTKSKWKQSVFDDEPEEAALNCWQKV